MSTAWWYGRSSLSRIMESLAAAVRWVTSTKARIPLLCDLHLNFIFLHYTYIISMALLGSVIVYPGSTISYTDALFLSAGAATQSGLNTVDLNLLRTYQQVVLYFITMLTTPIFIHTVLVFVRLYWFEKRFQHVVRDARALRNTRSRMRTISEDKENQTYDREEAGLSARPVVAAQYNQQAQKAKSSDSSSDSGTASRGSQDDPARQVAEQNAERNGRLGLGLGSLRVPTQLSPEQHIAFLEHQRQNKGALRIPSPREYDRGGGPQVLEEEDEEEEEGGGGERPKINRRLSVQSDARSDTPRSPRNVDGDDNIRPHITINEPDMVRSRTRNSTFPRLDTRPTVRDTKDPNDPSPTTRTRTRRPTMNSIYRSLTQEKDRPTQPYLSWNATVGRNSNFIDLTEEQRDELGGIEYRALKTLAVVLICYYVLFHLLGIICLAPWIMTTRWGEAVTSVGQGRPWWAIFTAGSAFNDLGFTLTPASMTPFQTAVFPLLLCTFLIVIGNTGFPCMLRLIIWALSKFVPIGSALWEEMKFLLDHPRRCFTLLFPRNATWWLFAILVALNGIDLIFFIILDLNDKAVTNLSTGIKILDGLFQAACTRTAGFSVVSLSDLHPAVQVSYMVMMYISVFPIAISMRRTNVYEEKSLGIYAANEDDDDDAATPTYIGAHLRRQLSFDLWYVFLGLFIIAIVEGGRLERTDEYSFQIWFVLFEIVSAYGTVGMSLGYPGVNASFCSQFQVISKLVIIAMQVRGRHRGLPYALDRAILLPSEHLNQNEVADAERRMRRRASSLSQNQSFERQPSHNNAVSSGLDPMDSGVPAGVDWANGVPIQRRHSTLRSQLSQR